MAGDLRQAEDRGELLLERAFQLQNGEDPGGLRGGDDGGVARDASLRHRRRLPHEARRDRLVEATRARPDPDHEREADRDGEAVGDPGGHAVVAHHLERVEERALPVAPRALLVAEVPLLLEAARRDEEAPSALAPRVVVDAVANEPAREVLVAPVTEHRVHDDRRIADREEAALTDGARHRDHHVGLAVAADLQHRREIGMREARRVIRDHARDVAHDRMRARGLRQRELRVTTQELGGTTRARDALHAEVTRAASRRGRSRRA